MPEPMPDPSMPEPLEAAPADGAPLADEPFEAEVVESTVPFHGKVWSIRSDRLRYGGAEITREYVDHTGAVAVLALDDHDRVLLIQQYRHPIRSRDWELPAGLLDVPGEPPLETARRELREEVDLTAERWSELARFRTTPGGSTEQVVVYLAEGIGTTDAFARSDEEADIVPRWVALDEVVGAVLDGRLANSILTIAVLALHARRSR
jgi:8-oxo-dGDP phosphatase